MGTGARFVVIKWAIPENIHTIPRTTSIFQTPCRQNFQNALSPHALAFPFGFSIFLSNPLELSAGFANLPNLAYFTENYFK